MEANPITYYPKPSAQPRKPIQPSSPKFSGAIDGFSNLIGVIDSNRMLELTSSDFFAMILPRTAMAYQKRGADDGRETFLREFSGLIGNVLITGWFGWGMMKLLGNRVNAYNPHGLPMDAPINATNLDAFNQLYQKALTDQNHAGEARKSFVKKVLGGIESENPKFMWEAQREGLFRLLPGERPKMLRTLLEKVLGKSKAAEALEKVRDLPFEEQLKSLSPKLDDQNGKLSEDAQDKLAQMFEPKSNPLSPDPGTQLLDEAAEAKITHWEKAHPYSELTEKLKDPVFRRKEVLKARLDLYQGSKQATESFVKLVDEEALSHGVTGTVHVKEGGKALASGQSRKNVLRELKYYLEHFVDRAAHEAQGDIKGIEAKLFNPAKAGFLHQLLPKAEDGLINAAIKQKHALTWIPISLSIGAAGAFTFYNQYITARKHGGKMFFPGEVGPEANAGKAASPSLANQRQNIPLNRSFQPFTGFQQGKAINGGGILA